MEQGYVPFGRWRRQNISLYPLIAENGEHQLSMNISQDRNNLLKEDNLRITQKTSLMLPTDTAFLSKISVENEIQLCSKYLNPYIGC